MRAGAASSARPRSAPALSAPLAVPSSHGSSRPEAATLLVPALTAPRWIAVRAARRLVGFIGPDPDLRSIAPRSAKRRQTDNGAKAISLATPQPVAYPSAADGDRYPAPNTDVSGRVGQMLSGLPVALRQCVCGGAPHGGAQAIELLWPAPLSSLVIHCCRRPAGARQGVLLLPPQFVLLLPRQPCPDRPCRAPKPGDCSP